MWDLRIMSGRPSKIWWALPGGKTCERGEKEPWLTWLTWRLKMFKSHYWHLLAVSSSGKRPICSIQLTERVTFQDWQGNYDEDRMKWLKISVLERNAWGLFWTPLDTVFSTQEGAYSEGKPKAAWPSGTEAFLLSTWGFNRRLRSWEGCDTWITTMMVVF